MGSHRTSGHRSARLAGGVGGYIRGFGGAHETNALKRDGSRFFRYTARSWRVFSVSLSVFLLRFLSLSFSLSFSRFGHFGLFAGAGRNHFSKFRQRGRFVTVDLILIESRPRFPSLALRELRANKRKVASVIDKRASSGKFTWSPCGIFEISFRGDVAHNRISAAVLQAAEKVNGASF